VLIVNGGPHHNRSLIRSAFRMAICRGRRERQDHKSLFRTRTAGGSLSFASCRKGVRVQLILPANNDVPLVRLVSRSYYTPLLKGGIEIFEREGTVLHAKVMLIDDSWRWSAPPTSISAASIVTLR